MLVLAGSFGFLVFQKSLKPVKLALVAVDGKGVITQTIEMNTKPTFFIFPPDKILISFKNEWEWKNRLLQE